MEVVTLPLVGPYTNVSNAIATMREHKRAGVVNHDLDADTYTLLYAGNLLRARAKGATTIADVPGGERVFILDAPTANQFGVDITRPHRTQPQAETMLDVRKVKYALLGAAVEEVMLITRHEGLKEMLSTTGGFQCTGTPTHYFPEPDVTLGQKCPEIPLCSRADGTPPWIEPA